MKEILQLMLFHTFIFQGTGILGIEAPLVQASTSQKMEIEGDIETEDHCAHRENDTKPLERQKTSNHSPKGLQKLKVKKSLKHPSVQSPANKPKATNQNQLRKDIINTIIKEKKVKKPKKPQHRGLAKIPEIAFSNENLFEDNDFAVGFEFASAAPEKLIRGTQSGGIHSPPNVPIAIQLLEKQFKPVDPIQIDPDPIMKLDSVNMLLNSEIIMNGNLPIGRQLIHGTQKISLEDWSTQLPSQMQSISIGNKSQVKTISQILSEAGKNPQNEYLKRIDMQLQDGEQRFRSESMHVRR